MKKFLAKLGLFIAINLMLVSVLIPVAAAAETAACDTTTVKEMAGSSDCIPQEEAGKQFITIMEEPLISIKKDEIKGFEARTCYRKTATCTITPPGGKPQFFTAASLVKDGQCKPEVKDGKTVSCKEVTVIFSQGGTVMISGYVAMIYRWAAPIVGMICVLVIVISGLQLSFSAGDSGAVDAARKRIVQSLSGLAVLFLSSVILYTINPNFFTAAIK